MISRPVLEVQNLRVNFSNSRQRSSVVKDVTFALATGETLALVGESGSGKSVTSLALMRLTPPEPFTQISGSAKLTQKNGEVIDLVSAKGSAIRAVRGNEISMVFQEPMTSLNPVHTVGDQISEALQFHRNMTRRQTRDEAVRLLDLVGIPDARKHLDTYPHLMSGGMRQRVMIAMAISCEPQVLIADEPTTALDVTVQAQILELFKNLQQKTGMAMVFITHNLGVVAEIADRVMVLYAGRIVEQAKADEIFDRPLMPYTRGLLGSIPRMEMVGRPEMVLEGIPGVAPDLSITPFGCAFHPRCFGHLPGTCDQDLPALEQLGSGREVRCVRWKDFALGPE